jgi:hypothetical protein
MFTGEFPLPPAAVSALLKRGLVIPAHPLALNAQRQFDEGTQRSLTRYYHAAGAGGIAVGVHTTQFEIRDRKHNLYEPVLRTASETAACLRTGEPFVLVAGVIGHTMQAVSEARIARNVGYHAALVSLAHMDRESDDELLAHVDRVAREIPVFGFYLQPAVGGRVLSYEFWRRFAELPNLIAVKVSPFNRYHTLDVVRAVAAAGRAGEVALYTGNDDAIVADLLTPFEVAGPDGQPTTMRFVGGLLGHWACWTRVAVRLHERCRSVTSTDRLPAAMLTLGAQVTDVNGALFDVANNFRGAITGVNEVLRRQGLLKSSLCLDPNAGLSPGQAEAIDRVCRQYPHLTDDSFVREHRGEWLT